MARASPALVLGTTDIVSGDESEVVLHTTLNNAVCPPRVWDSDIGRGKERCVGEWNLIFQSGKGLARLD